VAYGPDLFCVLIWHYLSVCQGRDYNLNSFHRIHTLHIIFYLKSRGWAAESYLSALSMQGPTGFSKLLLPESKEDFSAGRKFLDIDWMKEVKGRHSIPVRWHWRRDLHLRQKKVLWYCVLCKNCNQGNYWMSLA